MASLTPISEPHKSYSQTGMFGMVFTSRLEAGQESANHDKRSRFGDMLRCRLKLFVCHTGYSTILTSTSSARYGLHKVILTLSRGLAVYKMVGSDSSGTDRHRDVWKSISNPLDFLFLHTSGHDFGQGLTIYVYPMDWNR